MGSNHRPRPFHSKTPKQRTDPLLLQFHPRYFLLLSFDRSRSSSMASRMANMWRSLANSRRFTTSTAPKMKAFAPTANDFLAAPKPRGEFVPVYVALGLITLSVSFGLYTAKHELLYAPNVLVSKKKRETVPEVEDPDWAAAEADRFVHKSVFRKVAHLQDFDAIRAGTSDPTRAHGPGSCDVPKKVETLKSVGVDPRSH